jgi:hypothetical protein
VPMFAEDRDHGGVDCYGPGAVALYRREPTLLFASTQPCGLARRSSAALCCAWLGQTSRDVSSLTAEGRRGRRGGCIPVSEGTALSSSVQKPLLASSACSP